MLPQTMMPNTTYKFQINNIVNDELTHLGVENMIEVGKCKIDSTTISSSQIEKKSLLLENKEES